jgi:serine/threonine-protein kinase
MGRSLGPSADVFTAGVLAYQMTSGVLPFRGRILPELVGQMLQKRFTHVPSGAPDQADVPPDASAAIIRALASSPDARFPDAREFARALGLRAG